jgi:hypothetical protein
MSNEKYKLYSDKNTIPKIKCDLIYLLRRNINTDSELHKKLTRLERILFDKAWSDVLLKFIKDKELI